MKKDEQIIINGLKKQIQQIDDLLQRGRKNPEFNGWKTKTRRLLERIDGQKTSYVKDFDNISFSLMAFSMNTQDYEFEEAYQEGLKNAKEVLQGIVDELEELGLPNKATNQNANTNQNTNTANAVVNLNLHNNLNIELKTVLENILTVSQYKELNKILEIKDEKEKESKLKKFLSDLGAALLVEVVKSVLI